MTNFEQLNLITLQEGDLVRVIAGEEQRSYKYDFLVIKPGKKPECFLTQTNPNGVVVGPITVILEGMGEYLTQDENPVQWPGQITINHGTMRKGGFVIANDPNEKWGSGRVELMPACTAIEVYTA